MARTFLVLCVCVRLSVGGWVSGCDIKFCCVFGKAVPIAFWIRIVFFCGLPSISRLQETRYTACSWSLVDQLFRTLPLSARFCHHPKRITPSTPVVLLCPVHQSSTCYTVSAISRLLTPPPPGPLPLPVPPSTAPALTSSRWAASPPCRFCGAPPTPWTLRPHPQHHESAGLRVKRGWARTAEQGKTMTMTMTMCGGCGCGCTRRPRGRRCGRSGERAL